MLRFDVPPVSANVTRWEAFVSCVVAILAMLVSPWFMAILLVQGFVRGFLGHFKCPAHRLWNWLFTARGWEGAKENAGAKMFANKILFLASAVSLGLYAAGLSLWQVPVSLLIVFTALEWAFSFCAACWVYGAWYRWFPPKMS